jgi:hypothetical protein
MIRITADQEKDLYEPACGPVDIDWKHKDATTPTDRPQWDGPPRRIFWPANSRTCPARRSVAL